MSPLAEASTAACSVVKSTPGPGAVATTKTWPAVAGAAVASITGRTDSEGWGMAVLLERFVRPRSDALVIVGMRPLVAGNPHDRVHPTPAMAGRTAPCSWPGIRSGRRFRHR